MATDIKLKDILYKYKERIKEKGTHYMLSIISSGSGGCCSSTVPIREPPLVEIEMHGTSHPLLCALIIAQVISCRKAERSARSWKDEFGECRWSRRQWLR
jgi:hypothetical protein